jgi:hypothetical protein
MVTNSSPNEYQPLGLDQMFGDHEL